LRPAIFVGNDVVDLRDPWASSAAGRSRFVERVCTERERAMLARSREPCATFWTLFAAKEAAYKVVVKLRPATILAHRKFEVGSRGDELHYEGIRIVLHVQVAPTHVHVVAATRAGAHLAGVAKLPDDADSSIRARELLKAVIAARMGCASEELEIRREPRAGSWDGFGPPALVRGGALVEEADVSLSHDGGFVAFAATV
jgi:phosphopantetheinyl transferase (holo-ACP synthase)